MKLILAAPFLLAFLAGCSDNRYGTLALIVTDAPMPYEVVERATVEVDRITVDDGDDPRHPPCVLYEGDPLSIEISSLRNGIVRHLFSRNVPTYAFTRVHMHFSGAALALTNGRTFTSHDGSLKMPKQDKAGAELTIEIPIHVRDGRWSRLLLDMDLPLSFSSETGGDLLQADVVQFHPVLHAVRPGLSGEVRGIVSAINETGQMAPVANATVYILPAGSELLEMAVGATGTDSDGSFAKLGLPPGTYDVVALKGDVRVTHGSCVVQASNYTIVDLSLP